MDKNNQANQDTQKTQEEGMERKGGSTSMDQNDMAEDTIDTETDTYNLDYED